MKRAGDWHVYMVGPLDWGWEGIYRCFLADVPNEVLDAAHALGWEGDVRGDACGSFLVPVEGGFERAYCWKQDNNGTCFIGSPIPFAHLEDL